MLIRQPVSSSPRSLLENSLLGTTSAPAIRDARDVASIAEVESPDEQLEQMGQNSAAHYKNAFALYGRLSERDRELLSKPTEEIDASEAAELYERLQPILDLLHQGAASDYCDWELGPGESDTALPHFANSQNLHQVVR